MTVLAVQNKVYEAALAIAALVKSNSSERDIVRLHLAHEELLRERACQH